MQTNHEERKDEQKYSLNMDVQDVLRKFRS